MLFSFERMTPDARRGIYRTMVWTRPLYGIAVPTVIVELDVQQFVR
jgi:hypothetical protein